MSIKLLHGDCLDLMKDVSNESIDLVVTDCPYKIVSGGCTTTKNKMGGILSNGQNLKEVSTGSVFGHNDIQFKDWLPDIYRVLKDGTHCYIMINSRNLKDLQVEAEKVGFKFQNLLIWDKGNVTPNRYYMQKIELILMLKKGKARTINNAGDSNLFSIPNIRGKTHPTEKPVSLMEIFVGNSSNENDLVLDPFMGCGSTGIACKNLNRQFIGFEVDERYFNTAKERLL